MPPPITLRCIPAARLSPNLRNRIHQLCDLAYGEALTHLFAAYTADHHIVAIQDGVPVSHAMTVTRWLQAGSGPPLRTAYVELVATAPDCQGRGLATAVMERLAREIAGQNYALGALCPARDGLYRRLGWEYWRGPLFIRQPGLPGAPQPWLLPTPEERVMILRLPRTPPLDLELALSAEWRAGGELW